MFDVCALKLEMVLKVGFCLFVSTRCTTATVRAAGACRTRVGRRVTVPSAKKTVTVIVASAGRRRNGLFV